MLMNRISPLHLLDEMQKTFDLFDATMGNRPRFAAAYPALNAWVDDQTFYVEAELPGMRLEDLEIYVTDGELLTIKGQRNECACDQGKWLRRERGYGSFERQVQLPDIVDEERVEASLKNGVLTIKLPKSPKVLPRRIEVKGD